DSNASHARNFDENRRRSVGILFVSYYPSASGPSALNSLLPNVSMLWPKACATESQSRLCGVFSYCSARPLLNPRPPPRKTKGMLSCEWLLPLPSSFVHTIVV